MLELDAFELLGTAFSVIGVLFGDGDCTMNCVREKYTGGLHHERGKTGKTQNQ